MIADHTKNPYNRFSFLEKKQIDYLLLWPILKSFSILIQVAYSHSRMIQIQKTFTIQKVIMKDVIVESLSGVMSTVLIVIVSILVVIYYVDSSIDMSYIIVLIISL